jgi:uncharacterized membrane protein YidH (DUF202 family)
VSSWQNCSLAKGSCFLSEELSPKGLTDRGERVKCFCSEEASQKKNGYNLIVFLGIFLVFLGAGAGLLATYRFRKTEKEIIEDTYHPSVIADILVAILLGSIGILLAVYLVHTV